jgi:hypothetical protein
MINLANFVKTTLRTSVPATANVLPLAPGSAALLSYIPAGDYCYLTISDRVGREVVRYTSTGAIVGDNITVLRAQDGTSARTFPAGACVSQEWNEQQVKDLITQCIAAAAASTPLAPPNTSVGTGAPTAAPVNANQIYYIDLGVSPGQLYYWTGSVWSPVGTQVAVPPPPTAVSGTAPITVTGPAANRTVAVDVLAANSLHVTPANRLAVYDAHPTVVNVPPNGNSSIAIRCPPGASLFTSGVNYNAAGTAVTGVVVESLDFSPLPASGLYFFPLTNIPGVNGPARYQRSFIFRDPSTNAYLGSTNDFYINFL